MPLYIQDTADVVLERKSDGFKIATGSTQSVGISQKVDEEAVKGGIGNPTQFTIKSGKELEIKVQDALFDFQWLAATQGVKVDDNQTVKIVKHDVVEVKEGGAIEIMDKTVSADATVVDSFGSNHEATLASGAATVSELSAEVGKNVTVIYETEVTGKTIAIRADRFAEKYKCQLFTYAYDKDTEKIAKDVYVTFENVTPSSEFEMQFEAGKAMAPEITLRASSDPKTKEIGKYVLVDHKETPSGV